MGAPDCVNRVTRYGQPSGKVLVKLFSVEHTVSENISFFNFFIIKDSINNIFGIPIMNIEIVFVNETRKKNYSLKKVN